MKKTKKKEITVKLKAKMPKDKPTPFFAGMMHWFECPNCKKTVLLGEPQVIGALNKFKKQVKAGVKKNA